MDNEQKSEGYYKIAYQCAENKAKRACAPETDCGNCSFNVSLYVADAREAAFIKTTTAIDYVKARKEQRAGVLKNVIFAALVLAGVMWFGTTSKSQPGDTIQKAVRPATLDDIPRTIAYIATIVRDVNNDRLINCIDYAVLFYKYFPGDADIILNRNRATGMHHLFNRVWVNGKWIYLEPQGPKNKYDMNSVWGDKYNPYYNGIVTGSWAAYAK